MDSGRLRTGVYIDGFNFYYASFRRAGFAAYKWLDLVRFCDVALPRNHVEFVRMFTARLDPARGRGAQRARQDAYLAALATLPRLSVHYGEFAEHSRRRRDRTSIWRRIFCSTASATLAMSPWSCPTTPIFSNRSGSRETSSVRRSVCSEWRVVKGSASSGAESISSALCDTRTSLRRSFLRPCTIRAVG